MKLLGYAVLVVLILVGGLFFGVEWYPTFIILVIASIDNGAVLAEKALTLEDAFIPLSPRVLKVLPLLAPLRVWKQRDALPWIGLVLSLPMKAGFAFLAASLIHNHWVIALAGIYFVDLAFESFFSRSFVKFPVIWLFRFIISILIPSKGETQRYPSFWWTVISIDIIMESAFSLDEAILAASRIEFAIAAAYAMLLSTVAMRFATAGFQRLIEIRPIIGKAIYVSILFLGIELLVDLKIDIYEEFHIAWFKPFTSLLILLSVVFVAEVVRWVKPVFPHKGIGKED